MGTKPDSDDSSRVVSTGTTASLNGAHDTWSAAGLNLYVLVLPESNSTLPPTPKRSILASIIGLFVPGENASTLSIVSSLPSLERVLPGSFNNRFWHRTRRIEGWTLHQVALPSVVEQKQVTMPVVTLHELQSLLPQMLAFARTHTEHGTIGYLVIHVKELRPPKVQGTGLWSNHEKGTKNDPRTELRDALDAFDPPRVGEPRGYFKLYDSSTKHSGYLVVGRRTALLADLSDENFTTLALLLQGGALAPQGGFTAEGLAAVLTRVAQWDANQDVIESVDKLLDLKRSTDAATYGQIWLSYALALIGVTLSIISLATYPNWLIPGLVLLGLSCVIHARYAQKGTNLWRSVGKVIFLLGALAIIVGFLLGFLFPPPPPPPKHNNHAFSALIKEPAYHSMLFVN